MRYVAARLEEYARSRAYRIYVTDALKAIGRLDIRYEDLFKPVDKRTPDEIISGITEKLKGVESYG